MEKLWKNQIYVAAIGITLLVVSLKILVTRSERKYLTPAQPPIAEASDKTADQAKPFTIKKQEVARVAANTNVQQSKKVVKRR